MNKNSIVGIILILGILVGWSVWVTPSKEEIERQRHYQDSVIRARKAQYIADSLLLAEEAQKALSEQESLTTDTVAKNDKLRAEYGAFASLAEGEDNRFTVENDVLKVDLSTLGGAVKRVELKNYVTWDSLPLVGFDDQTSCFNLAFFSENRSINTKELQFVPYLNGEQYQGAKHLSVDADSLVFAMRLVANDNPDQYLEYRYTFKKNEYMIGFDIVTHNFRDIISANTTSLAAEWHADLLQQEKAVDRFNGSTIYYKFDNDEVESLSDSDESAEEELRQKIKWISFKQRFFSYALIADNTFNGGQIAMQTLSKKPNPRYLRTMDAVLDIPYNGLNQDNVTNMSFYFGPNSLKTMEQYNIDLDKVIPLGGWLVAWINRYVVVNIFNWLGSYGWNYGIVILILTIIIKICL